MSVDVEKLGAPGVRGALTIIAHKENETRQDKDRLGDTTERKFKVSTRLTKYPVSSGDFRGDFTALDGSSYIQIAPDQTHLVITCPIGEFRIDKNAGGELSMISMDIDAQTMQAAHDHFLEAIGPTLDHLSYLANASIITSLVRVIDDTNDVQELYCISPHRPFVLGSIIRSLKAELLPAYSIYREAKNSNSVFYQLLCYYKIIEGLQKLRDKAIRRARKANLDLRPLVEKVPPHEDLAPGLQPWVGKSIKSFFDTVLTKHRDRVAHYILKEGTMLHISSPAQQAFYADMVFACELCARVLIRSHGDLLGTADGRTS
jgi:hypothetical protein